MAASSSAPVLVYADGSCEGNPGPGGWGVVIVTPAGKHRISGGDSHTTNNRMEIMAAIEALRALDRGLPVILRSDSQYLVKTMNEGWRRTKNLDLWQQLDDEVARHNVRFEWVRGHTGDAGNEEADELARAAARSAARSRAPRRPGATGFAAAAKPAQPPCGAGRAAQAAARPAPAASAAGRPADTHQPARAAGGTAAAALPAPTAPAAPSDDELVIAELSGLLDPGERIVRCGVCKQAFIARGDEHYCPLIACQMIKRQ